MLSTPALVADLLIWNRGHKSDYDAWALLGSLGWDWKSFLPFQKKSESFVPGIKKNTPAGGVPVYDLNFHGSKGPLNLTYAPYAPSQFESLYEAFEQVRAVSK